MAGYNMVDDESKESGEFANPVEKKSMSLTIEL